MKFAIYLLALFAIPGLSFGLTTAEFYSFAPELINSINGSWALIYTVCTGSFIAFYFFGWSANWMLRLCGFLLFFAFLDGSTWMLAYAFRTQSELFLMYLASTNVCSPDEVARHVFEFAQGTTYCTTPAWGTLEVTDERYQEIIKSIRGFMVGNGIIGGGFSGASLASPSGFLGQNLLFLFGSPLLGLGCASSVLIWLLCPSKRFFIRKGWIRE